MLLDGTGLTVADIQASARCLECQGLMCFMLSAPDRGSTKHILPQCGLPILSFQAFSLPCRAWP